MHFFIFYSLPFNSLPPSSQYYVPRRTNGADQGDGPADPSARLAHPPPVHCPHVGLCAALAQVNAGHYLLHRPVCRFSLVRALLRALRRDPLQTRRCLLLFSVEMVAVVVVVVFHPSMSLLLFDSAASNQPPLSFQIRLSPFHSLFIICICSSVSPFKCVILRRLTLDSLKPQTRFIFEQVQSHSSIKNFFLVGQ